MVSLEYLYWSNNVYITELLEDKPKEKKMQVVTDKNGKEWEVEERCLVEKKREYPYFGISNGSVVLFTSPLSGIQLTETWGNRLGVKRYDITHEDEHTPVTPKWEEV